MNLLKKLFGTYKFSLKTLINEKLDEGEIIQHKLPFIDNLEKSLEFKFYKTDYKNKYFWIEAISDKLKVKHTYTGYNLIVVFDGNVVTTIVFDWVGLKELGYIFENSNIFGKDGNFYRKLFLFKHDIETHLKSLSKNYKEVLDSFPDIAIKNDVIELQRTIIPNRAYINKNSVVEIPKESAIPITKIIIYTDPSGLISSVNIIGKHPNADKNGWFCLGNLKMIPFCVKSINTLTEQIKSYKLDDCYWKPRNYKEW